MSKVSKTSTVVVFNRCNFCGEMDLDVRLYDGEIMCITCTGCKAFFSTLEVSTIVEEIQSVEAES